MIVAYRVMDRRGDCIKILREQEALEAGYLVTPFGDLLRARFEEAPSGKLVGYFEEVSEEDFAVLRVIGCG